ncbi:HEAT repeat domain-containing protein [Marisediminicola sp. LYQ85]|uniref:HEAT repeat domain-containing protein n=1 Tax=Marisediminicola sp. LYQ85 TaxID=3391062 RepID=UPI00398305AC
MTSDTLPDPLAILDDPIGTRFTKVAAVIGPDAVVERALALLAGANAGEDFLLYAGGKHAKGVLEGAPALYWPEVWGARALLYVWNDTAVDAVIAGLTNEAWRVREMCARVAAERGVEAPDHLRALLTDDVARVRAVAAEALAATGGSADLDAVHALVKDGDLEVRKRAGAASRSMRARLGG